MEQQDNDRQEIDNSRLARAKKVGTSEERVQCANFKSL